MRRLDLSLLHTPATRREALLGALTGMAGLAACGSTSEGETGASGAPTPGTIDHVIVLMMENRSFDHVFGARSLEEGLPVDGLAPGMSNPLPDGTPVAPFPTGVDCVADPPHGWTSAHEQHNAGANDGFVRAYAAAGAPDPAEAMGYLTRARVPVSHALADQYALCDAWHASVMGPTWPNRFYAHGGTSDGQRGNDLAEGGGAFRFPTVWHKLGEAGVEWGYYYTDVPFLGLFDGLMAQHRHALLEDFLRDAERGTLPAVAWVDPGFTWNDDHPPHHPALGQELIAAVVNALARGPLWERCLLVITYDEHGGFFDHVPPPTTADDHAARGFDQLGFRVPALLVGPWVRQGVVHERLEHASWLAYVCERFGIAPWTQRIGAATSLSVALDAERMARGEPLPPPVLPAFDVDDDALPAECFYGSQVVSRDMDLDAHGTHVTALARVAERVAPGSVRLEVGGVGEVVRRQYSHT